MPFVDGLFETVVQVRTLHHAADVPAVFRELHRIAHPHAAYILEFANKRNLKAILRYWARKQAWSPFNPDPLEFVELNFDFHPRWIREKLREEGFVPGRMLTVSHFRVEQIKKLVPLQALVAMDSAAQLTGNWWQLSPSVFVRNEPTGAGEAAAPGSFFACPSCQTPLKETAEHILTCEGCGRRWQVNDGLYDFKEPLP
jgi:hypothetical protein